MLTLPGDIPLVTPGEITQLLRHTARPPFTIAPSRDERGSNAILCRPPTPSRCALARTVSSRIWPRPGRGIGPRVLRLPGIALDIDTPEDLALLRGWPRGPAPAHAGRKYDLLRG